MKEFLIEPIIGVKMGEVVECVKFQKKRIFTNKSIAAVYIHFGTLISGVKKMAEKR
ncbi:MAG: Transposase [Candidatus Midichloria mitochondrii]